jgi:hypothetical protein
VTSRIQIVAIAGSLAFLLLVLELVRRRRLAEEYSALWIVAALTLLVASIRRDLIDRSALWLGIYYGPAVLLLGLLVAASALLLWMSVVLSRQQAQIDNLVEETAILGAELRETRARDGMDRAGKSAQKVVPAARS